MSEINYNIGLCGEYRLVVQDNDIVITDTGWCKNTILSGGLEFLSTNSILNAISFVDFGTSSALSNDYTLLGILEPCINSELLSVSSGNIQYYQVNKSTQVYYSIYSSPPITLRNESINEFCIKTGAKTGFARAVLPESVNLRVGQNINFEYRVSVDHSSEYQTDIEFKTPNLDSFYLPVTSKTFKVPNIESNPNRIGRLVDNYNLLLVQNNDDFPEFGETYPSDKKPMVCGVGKTERLSRFTPSTVYSGLDASRKQYSVITLYSNISAPYDSGVFGNINSTVLTYDSLAFHITKFAFPLALYNTSLYSDLTSTNTSNLLSLYYMYTWGETIQSPFTTPTTFSLSAPQLIPCNINQEIDLYPDSFVTLFSNSYTTPNTNGNTTRIRVNLKSTFFENIDINYFTSQIDKTIFPYGPSPYRVIIYNSNNDSISDTGYVFPNTTQSWDYTNSPTASFNYYNARLYSAINQSIVGSISGSTVLTNTFTSPGDDYIDIVINSPFVGTSWKLVLDTRASGDTYCPAQSSICMMFNDIGLGSEFITLTGSLSAGQFDGIYSEFNYPVSLEWNNSSGDWELLYNNINLNTDPSSISTITGNTARCNPVGATIYYEDSVIIVNAEVLNFNSCTQIDCNTLIVDGGVGVTNNTVFLSPSGGVIIIDFDSYSVPDKLELIHNNTKVATSSMSGSNSGPFDNIYGDPLVPTYNETLSTNQFIGLDKGVVPTRETEFILETGITDISVSKQQLVWWVYTPSDYIVSDTLTIRVTGPSGTAWEYIRRCTNEIPFTPPPGTIVVTPSTFTLNDLSISDGTLNASVINPTSVIDNDLEISDGTFNTTVINPASVIDNNLDISNGTLNTTVIDPTSFITNNLDISNGTLNTSVINPTSVIDNDLEISDGTLV